METVETRSSFVGLEKSHIFINTFLGTLSKYINNNYCYFLKKEVLVTLELWKLIWNI